MENFTELCGYNDIQEIFNENQIYQNQELTEQFSIMDNFHETLSVCSDVSSSNSKNERNSYKKQMDADTSIVLRESANERERKRTRAVNEAFENLRMALPSYAVKPCKIQTLKLAIRFKSLIYF